MKISPDASAKELEQLVETDDPNICQQVAGHPNVTPELLKQLFCNYGEYVFANPNFERIVTENPDFLFQLDSSYNYFQREPLPAICYELAIDSNEIWYVQEVAQNPHTPLPILEQLIEDKRPRVHAALGLNENFPAEKLEQVVRCYGETELADFIEATSELNENYFDCCNMPQFYYDVTMRYLDTGRRPFIGLFWEIADNRFTPIEVLRKLADNEDPNVRSTVASNPSTPLDVLEKLVLDEHEEVLLSLACNKNISLEILNQLASQINHEVSNISEKDYYLILGLAGNPQTPQQVLRFWANHLSSEVRAKVAENLNTPSDVLETLANEKYPKVLSNVANNPHTPIATLEKLIRDTQVTEDPFDPYKYIPMVAKLNLNRKS